MLNAWKVQSFHGSEWIFPNRSNKPQEMGSFQKRLIIPVLEKKVIGWHGLYAGRRAATTLLVQLTEDAVAAQYVLRRKNLSTTTAFYVKPVQTAAAEGMKLVEATLANRKALAEANGK